MADNQLAVDVREATGKGVARKLRAAGRVPAVLYGHGNSPVSLVLDPRTLERKIRESDAGLNTLFDLEGDAKVAGKTVLIKELQRDPVRGFMIHADLYEVDPNQTINVSVPIHVLGTPIGVSLGGGILDQVLREIEVACLPRAIPEVLEVDVSSLELGDSLHVRDIPLPEGAALHTDPDLSVLSVSAPSVAEEETPAVEEGEEGEEAVAEGDAKPEDAKAEEKPSEEGS